MRSKLIQEESSMFKKLSVVVLAVLLSTTASAQTKKRAKKKAPAQPKVEEPLPETPPAAEATPEPAPVMDSAPATTSMAATGTGTEFNHQANDGHSELNLGLGYQMLSKADGKSGGVVVGNVEGSGLLINLSYDFGLTANNSVGIATDYGTLTTKESGGGSSTDLKYAGLGDIFITSKNRSPMGGWNLNYGAALGFSGGKYKAAAGGPPAVEGTRVSGGMSVPLYVGGEWQMGDNWLGLRLDYAFLMERQVDSAGDPKLTGGHPMKIKLFYEGASWNVYGGIVSVGETTLKVGALEGKSAAYSGTLLGAGWWTQMSPTTLMGLNYDLTMWNERDYSTTIKLAAQMQHDIGVRFRFEF
jgi:hypothetical protein